MAEDTTRLDGIVELLGRDGLSAEPGPSAFDVYALVAERIDVTQWRPRLADGVEAIELPLSGGGSYFIVTNPVRSVHYRLTPDEAALLGLLDGCTTVGELLVNGLETNGELDAAHVVGLVKLLEVGHFLQEKPVDVYAALDRALNPPRFLSRVDRFARTLTIEWSGAETMIRAGYRFFFRPFFSVAGAAVAVATTLLGLLAFADVMSTHHFHLSNRHFGIAFVVLLLLDLFIIFIHEFGHAAVLVHYGRRVRGAGFRIYYGSPAFFIDSADALMLPTGRRIFQSAAGPIVELCGTSAASILLWLFPAGVFGKTLYQFIIINYFVLFLNIVPMLELDGYWMLSDALHQPDLRPKSLAFARREMWRKLWRRESFSRSEVGLAVFGLAGMAFTIFAIGSAWFFWKRVFGDSVAAMWHGGIGGRLLLLLLFMFLAGPTIRLALAAGRSLLRRARAVAHRIRFRLETSWRVEAATLLDESGLFGDVPAEVLSELAGRLRLHTLAPGAILIRQGDPSDAFYLVRQGAIEIYEERRDGATTTLRVEGRGAGIGDQGLIEGALRSASARAVETTEVFQIDKATFDRLLIDRSTRVAFAPTFQLVDELRGLRSLGTLSDDALVELSRKGWWINLVPGQVLFKQGDAGETFCIIEHGRLEVEIDGELVRTLGPGEHVGEMALLLDSPRTATVRAVTAARLFSIDRATFDALIASQFRRDEMRPYVAVDAIRYH
jgi:putative peptide zinc metalloprotease protein